MNILSSAKELRASLPKVVQRVRRGARFTVLYRSQPAFEVIPVGAASHPMPPLEKDPLYRAKPLARTSDGLTAGDHDRVLYGK